MLKEMSFMFCPSCGNKIDPTKKFCENCGSPVDTSAAEPEQQFSAPDVNQGFPQQTENNMQTPVSDNNQQFSAAQPGQTGDFPAQNSFAQGSNPPQPSQQVYSGTMPITNGARTDSYYDLSYPTKAKKSSAKKFIIIGVVALLIAVIGVTAFFLIRKKLDRDFIVNNPTKSTFSSYEKFIEENESGNPFYNLFKNAKKSGTISVTASGKVTQDDQSKDIKASASYGYDVNNCNYYFKLDAADMLVGVTVSEDPSAAGGLFETDFNKDNAYFNFDLFGTKGKYYIDNKTFRDDINNSIFSPDKDNVLNVTDKESFDKFVDTYEKIVKELGKVKDSGVEDGQMKESYENMIKLLEEKGNVKVEDGSAELTNSSDKKSVSADVITYSYDKKNFKELVTGLKDELKKLIESSDIKTEGTDSMDESAKSFLENFESSAKDNFNLTIKVYLDKNTHSALKTTIDMTGVDDTEGDGLKADFQFIKAPDNLITLNISVTSKGTESKLDLKLRKTDDNTNLKYELDAVSTSNSTESKLHASLEYNRSSGDFTFSAGLSDQGMQITYKGKLEISDNSLKLKLPDIYKNEAVELSLDIDYSTAAPAKPDVSDAKNLLKLSKDEFTTVFGGAGNTLSALTGMATQQTDYSPYDYDYDTDDYDYDYDDGSQSSFSSGTSNYTSDASSIDNALKSFYAGIMAGAITSADDSKYPPVGSTASARKQAASDLTIGDALEYHGLNNLKNTLYRYGADSKGNVYTIYDSANSDKIVFYFDSSTKLGDIYNQ